MNHLKSKLMESMDFVAEINELIGNGRGTTRRCWNTSAHDDSNPSFSFSPRHGGWKCHGCNETGDIFTLYMAIHGVSFWESYKFYLQKYGLWSTVIDFRKSKFYRTKRKQFKTVTRPNVKQTIAANMGRWRDRRNEHKVAFMLIRYGLTVETLERWKVCIGNDGRLWIPIWAERSTYEDDRSVTSNLTAFVNVRKHDAFRSRCQWWNRETNETSRKKPEDVTIFKIANQDLAPWEPMWSERTGKVTSEKGHGSTYVYPAEILFDNSMIYIVGGELKALLLNQLGVPAVSFTTGEGSIAEMWLPYFIGKRVRIIMDADPEKYDKGKYPDGNPTEKKKMMMAQVFADSGAITEVMDWPKEVISKMPKGGDITDLLRMCGWDSRALELMSWRSVERRLTEDEVKDIPVINTTKTREPEWDKSPKVKFHDLVDPRKLNEWVRVRALISGLNETPFVVPSKVAAVCHAGMANMRPKCSTCNLASNNFRKTVRFSVESQVSMVGSTSNEEEARKRLGVPKRCWEPEVEISPASVQVAVLTPTVEHDDSEDGLGERFEHRVCYMVGEDRIRVRENATYDLKGQVIADPKKGTFTLSASEWRDVDDDIFSHTPDIAVDSQIKEALEGTAEQARDKYVGRIRDHVVRQIIGQDQMIEVILLSYFMPFVFQLGGQVQERVCPSVLILGDTTVGKSTATNKIRKFFGAGRMYAANADPTHAGLIGGVMQLSNRSSSFHWGTIPTSHGAHLALDEYNKLSLDTIGKITNVISSGIAERLTVNGPRRTMSWVRMLYLANPRGERQLSSFQNPLDCALYVCGTVQDLGRVDLVHVQYKLKDRTKYGKMLKPTTDDVYDQVTARYHLQWAWSRRKKHIKFDCVDFIFNESLNLSDEFGGHAVFLPAQARFKLARIAAAYAMMLFSCDEHYNVMVTKEHVGLASDLIKRCYSPYISSESGMNIGTLPSSVIEVLNKVKNYKRLRFLANSDRWSQDDLRDALGRHFTEFIDEARYSHGMISKQRQWFVSKDPAFQDNINDYISSRMRTESFYSEAKGHARKN